MPKLSFQYSFQKDAWAWVLIAKSQSPFSDSKPQERAPQIPPQLFQKIDRLSYDKAQKEVVRYLKQRPKQDLYQEAIKAKINSLEKVWPDKEKEFFKRLSKITQKPIYQENFQAYFTTGFMCPYNEKENWFTLSIWHGLPYNIKTIAHELFHLQFLHYYKNYCRQHLSKKQTEDLKEALTFILNTDFNDLLLVQDEGYPAHQKMRTELEKIWRKDKDFGGFLEKAFKIILTS